VFNTLVDAGLTARARPT